MTPEQSPLDERRAKTTLWGISLVSFCWSMSSLMVFSVLPTFLTDELKVSHLKLGMLEGVAICSAFIAKVFAGMGSDLGSRRKPYIMMGTLFTIITKPLFALSFNFYAVFAARFLDRLSKGIRSSPTDALIADMSQSKIYGAAYGLRQSFYTFGAVVGATLAMLLMVLSGDNYRLVFFLSTLPALCSFFILYFFVHDRKDSAVREVGKSRPTLALHLRDINKLPASFWKIIFITFVLMMARFSEAFLAIRIKNLGMAPTYLPLVIIFMDVFHAGLALPMGKLSDQMSKLRLLVYGLLLFLGTHIVLSLATNLWWGFFGILLVGIHMGVTQGLLRAMVAETTPAHFKGTAFAIFYFVSGIAILLGNLVAGYLADLFGPKGAFLGGGSFTLLTLLLVWVLYPTPSSKN